MSKQLYIPACKKYLMDENGVMDVQKLFSLSRQAYSLKYPKEFPDNQELLSFLQVNNLVPNAYRVEDLNTEQVELCFSVITKHNCNSLCQLCGYSPLYKNLLEEQESVLLGYALSNWDNLQALIRSGITSRHFRAMLLMSEKSKVPVVPLNRLAFEFIEKIPKSQSDMRNLPERIINAIKENNKNKLSATDLKLAQHYLENLQKSSYQHVKTEMIQSILKKDYRMEFISSPEENREKPNGSVYIGGFLGEKIPVKSSDRNTSQEQPAEKQIGKEVKEQPLPNMLSPNEESAMQVTQKQPNSILQNPQSTPESKATKKITHKVIIWSLSKSDLNNSISVDLEHVSKQQYKTFIDLLLITPILPMEIGTIEKEPVVFIYMEKKMYYFSIQNHVILDDMIPYITQSRFRKIICYEPYYLYSYLYEQQISSVNLFSIKIFTDCYEDLNKNTKHPKALIKKLLQKENKTSVHDLYFSMSNYQELYETTNLKYPEKDEYKKKMLFCQLLGFSFQRHYISNTSLPLFKEETADDYVFTYSPDESIKEPFKPIQVEFSWNDTANFPVYELLLRLAAVNFYYRFRVYLLFYDKNTVTFAIHKDKITNVCEIINNVSCSIAEEQNKIPINVAVSILS